MRGFGRRSFFSNFRTPSPQPSPLWGEGVRCASFADFHRKHLRSRGASRRPSFFCARLGMNRAPAKIRSREARNWSGPRKGQGWGLSFGLPYLVSSFVGWAKARSAVPTLHILGLSAWASLRSAPPYKNEGSGTPANAGHQPPHLAMRRALIRSAHACRRSTAALT